MKKISISLFLLFTTLINVLAQKSELLIKSSDKGIYLEHKVQSKESFYALGRMYNIDPKLIASFNALDYNKGLRIDQKLRIPLTSANFIQDGNKGTPVYYKVGDKEGLMTVSNKNKNVLLTNLRWWNKLSSDEVKADAKLIVGFIQSASMKSITIAGKPSNESEIVKQKIVPVKEDTTKVPKNPMPIEEDIVKENKNDPVTKKNENEKPAVIIKEIKPAVVREEVNANTIEQGFFKKYFQQQIKTNPAQKDEMVTAGIFKTTSGWQDAKYYLLIDNVSPGTIIKVINPTNSKAVYAKVLGEMSGIRQNAGLNIRISNAAATALEIKDDNKFIVKVNY